MIDAAGGSVEGLKVAVLALTFKPETDDMREAPSIYLIEALQRAGASISAHDPEGMEQARGLLEDVAFFSNPYACAEGADSVVLMTEWESLKRLDLQLLLFVVRTPVLVDLRNVFTPDELERHGFDVRGAGDSGPWRAARSAAPGAGTAANRRPPQRRPKPAKLRSLERDHGQAIRRAPAKMPGRSAETGKGYPQ